MANRLYFTLREKNIKQEALAERLGIAASIVSRWCTNKAQPPTEYIYQIAGLLNINPYDLLYTKTVTIKLEPEKEIKLSTLGCNDGYLAMAFSATKYQLKDIDHAILKFTYKKGSSTFTNPLILLSTPYQSPKIPLIEIHKIVHNCKSTTLTLEHCKVPLTVAIGCPHFATEPLDIVPAEKIIV